ncbi:MAG: hypothetical protein HQK55_09645 [Deltaproteobacteria bacterium]|nr:hypothetical protein [Deltaproteobacteria bacterium]
MRKRETWKQIVVICAMITLGLMVTVGSAQADPKITAHMVSHHIGKCDNGVAEVKFEGKIEAKGVKEPVTIKYRFLRSDGAKGPEFTHEFHKDGSIEVHDTWTCNGEGWVAIQIDHPHKVESNKAKFHVKCK